MTRTHVQQGYNESEKEIWLGHRKKILGISMAEVRISQEQEPEKGEETDIKKEKGLPSESEESLRAIVGIGASAGGLEALELFFNHMPAQSGMAFVVIQHQDPEQTSLLPEILQRYTEMQVVAIGEGMKALPNTVYIKPSDYDIAIIQGNFTLLRPGTTAGRSKLTIDIFFRQLAEDQDGKAVGIILSGMGSDGTLGIRTLKEHSGMTMAQDPASATFRDMPQSAIATGLVDYVATPEDLPKLLNSYVNASSQISQVRIPQAAQPREIISQTAVVEGTLAKIFVLIRSKTGQDFSRYKRSTIMRRIERRMSLHQLINIDDYARYLQDNPPEVEILAKEMLIGITQFFRDPDMWHRLQSRMLPGLIQSKPHDSMLRVWVVGCSTGEEAYTIAIILQECLDALGKSGEIRFQIFATDTDSEAIDIARLGKYPSNIEVDVSPERLERFFIKEDGTYRIRQQLRDKVTFATHNIIGDPPFAHLDILSCRNLLIYLSQELQKKLIQLFHYALDPSGILLLGISESIGELQDLFSVLDSMCKIFQRRDVPSSLHAGLSGPIASFAVPLSAHETWVQPPAPAPATGPSITTIAQEQLLESFAPPAVIVTENGDIVYIHGRTGRYLEPSPGKANLNLLAMAREGLRYSLLSALRTAAKEKREVAEEESVRTNGELERIRMIVRPIPRHQGRADLFLVAFQDMPEPQQAQPEKPGEVGSQPDIRIADLERELADTRTQLQHITEERQSAREELTTMNEELQSTNEELQSTNEELTTSKEELQSMNEEILTVNSELQAKIVTLSQNQDDMRNLLQSTRIPMLFLDNDLKVKRFTEDIKEIVRLIQNDIGRPITDLKLNLSDESLARDIREVLDTLQVKEKQVMIMDGKWFQMIIRPYRTYDNRIDGVVITFSDITTIKKLEQSIQDARNFAENIIATIIEPLVVLNADLRVVSANRSFYRTFRVTPEVTEGELLYNLGNSQWDISQLRKMLTDILKENKEFEGYEIEHDFPGIGHRIMLLNARRVQSDARQDLILLAIEDVTNRPASEIKQQRVIQEKD
jgi:two-component system CheB/CheR fusion protein